MAIHTGGNAFVEDDRTRLARVGLEVLNFCSGLGSNGTYNCHSADHHVRDGGDGRG